MDSNALYEKDFYAWIQYHIELLKQGKLEQLDVDILIDELESMGKRDKRELASHFIVLIAHLLKWQFNRINGVIAGKIARYQALLGSVCPQRSASRISSSRA